jgi:hypothetical protein
VKGDGKLSHLPRYGATSSWQHVITLIGLGRAIWQRHFSGSGSNHRLIGTPTAEWGHLLLEVMEIEKRARLYVEQAIALPAEPSTSRERKLLH